MPQQSVMIFGVPLAPAVSTARNATLEKNNWSRRTTQSVLAGIASTFSDTDGVAGTSFGWEIRPRVAVEERGAWFRHEHDAPTFAADVKAQLTLTDALVAVPFVGSS